MGFVGVGYVVHVRRFVKCKISYKILSLILKAVCAFTVKE